jgi:hypothetical protein
MISARALLDLRQIAKSLAEADYSSDVGQFVDLLR